MVAVETPTDEPADQERAAQVYQEEYPPGGTRHGADTVAQPGPRCSSDYNEKWKPEIGHSSILAPIGATIPGVSADNVLPYFCETPDGLTQLRRHWVADEPKAVVLLVHGIGEHTGRYEHVGRFLAGRGYDVLAADNRGFGQSGGKRAYVDSFDQYLADVEALLDERREDGLPVVLFGHSLGGLICATYLVSARPQPDLAVLSAPALAAEVPLWQRLAAPLIGRIKPDLFLPAPIEGNLLSRDPEVGDRYAKDPLVVKGSTAGLGHSILATMGRTSAAVHRITLPTYVFHGGDDNLVPTASSEALGDFPNVTRRVWPGLRHECLNEPEQAEVLEETVAWLDDQLDQ